MADQLALPQGATIGDTPAPAPSAPRGPVALPQGASIAEAPAGALPKAPQASILSRSLEGAKQAGEGAIALPKMFLAPPQDAKEHAIFDLAQKFGYTMAQPSGGATALGAWRLANHVVEAGERMLKAPAENFKQAQVDYARAVEEFHNKDYREALASAGAGIGHSIGTVPNVLMPGGVAGGQQGEELSELAEGTRREGNLATPLTRAAINTGLAFAGEELPKYVGQKMTKWAPEITNGLLRANKEKNFLYGKDPGRALLDERIRPTNDLENLFEQLDDIGRDTNNRVLAKVNNPNVRTQLTDITPDVNGVVDSALQKLAKERGLKNRMAIVSEIQKMRDELLGTYDTSGRLVGRATRTRLAPSDLVQMRRSVGRSIQWDALEPDPEVREFVNNVRKDMYAKLNNRIEQAAPGVRELNKDYSDNIEARRLLARRIAQEGKNDIGLNRLLGKSELYGGIKLIASGEPITGGLLIANRVMRTPIARLARAQMYTDVAPILQRPGTANAAVAGVVAGQQARKAEENQP